MSVTSLAAPDPATTHWVPVGPGSGVRYLGDWAAGSYNEGDIVVYGGITYFCVAPTTDVPSPWPPAPTVPYGTSLPASPVDGTEAILVDSTSAPNYQWRFRYNAASTSAYKWEFVGGSPLALTEQAGVTLTNGAALGAVGPVAALPRAGVYIADFQVSFYGGVPAYITFGITGPYPPGTALLTPTYDDRLAAANEAELASMRWVITVPSAMNICSGEKANESDLTSINRSLIVTPVRVA